MPYKLATELKDAGFPQNFNEHPRQIGETDLETVSLPTLEELIEACGNDIARVWRVRDSGWCATGTNDFLDEQGATPTEAVARLWLALQSSSS
jgi:hypothetical protein